MRNAVATALVCCAICPAALGLGQDQLYTGDASTVPPGQVQFQMYYTTTFSSSARLTASALTFGTTGNSDVRLTYGFLWNDRGPDAQVGPNVGLKWRFLGDGRRKPSMSVSGLWASNSVTPGRPHKDNIGALLIVEYPTPYVVFLGNFGRVWVGGNASDLRYTALALGRFVSKRLLTAIQYINIAPIGSPGGGVSQDALGFVYFASNRVGYSLQIGYLPGSRGPHWSTTMGFSRYF